MKCISYDPTYLLKVVHTNIATNLHASWSCFSSFLNACILYLNTDEMYFIWSHLFAESLIRTQTLMLLLENDPANLNFMVFCKNIINEIISSHIRSKPYINPGIRYWYKNVHFHNNQPSFNDHHSPILRACELSQGGVFRRDQTGDGRCECSLE